jgi:hypothetical protein
MADLDRYEDDDFKAGAAQPLKEGMRSNLGRDQNSPEIPAAAASLQPSKEELADVEPGQPGRKEQEEKDQPARAREKMLRL